MSGNGVAGLLWLLISFLTLLFCFSSQAHHMRDMNWEKFVPQGAIHQDKPIFFGLFWEGRGM